MRIEDGIGISYPARFVKVIKSSVSDNRWAACELVRVETHLRAKE